MEREGGAGGWGGCPLSPVCRLPLPPIPFHSPPLSLSLTHTRIHTRTHSQCTAAFARALLDPATPIPPGVWSPEALPPAARGAILRDAGAGTGAVKGRPRRFELGRADWEIATEPTRLGFGIYI